MIPFQPIISIVPTLVRVQDVISKCFRLAQTEQDVANAISAARDGILELVTADPVGTPTASDPFFKMNTANLRLWTNCGSSWHYVLLT